MRELLKAPRISVDFSDAGRSSGEPLPMAKIDIRFSERGGAPAPPTPPESGTGTIAYSFTESNRLFALRQSSASGLDSYLWDGASGELTITKGGVS